VEFRHSAWESQLRAEVSGGILGVVPGRFGVAILRPALDARATAWVGMQHAKAAISEVLDFSIFLGESAMARSAVTFSTRSVPGGQGGSFPRVVFSRGGYCRRWTVLSYAMPLVSRRLPGREEAGAEERRAVMKSW